ncbi:hypothetical protein VitviT2T_025938 [Vitis vinifera]|uniref:UspA domain-containing protein n=2 Tax=Vitis vinifera TaxID=29760 RepID=A0ABY9DMA1_VITVI|nr:uncharacterized protein LOC100249148 [Vitis vinifera]WKA08196.1 hypothetical protein VitviT2T_025938 [Vitis vinifera]|eukprot:XP_002275136.2 PREDICTED: uncharacterized protein LOC100249148 [Vitis vinifera]
MDMRKIVVVVEDVEAARTAFEWALHNLLRYGDLITLLHVFPKRSRSKKKLRLSRLKGFQLALSFKDICSDFPNTKIEIVVTEGDQEGDRIVAVVREIGASALVVGLHDQSFLYKLAMAHNNIASSFNCRVLAVKSNASSSPDSSSIPDSSTNMDFSQIDLAGLHVPDPPPPKIRYRICPSPSAIIWRSSGSSRRKSSSREEAQFRLIRST